MAGKARTSLALRRRTTQTQIHSYILINSADSYGWKAVACPPRAQGAGGALCGVRRRRSYSFRDLCVEPAQQAGAGRLEGAPRGAGPVDFWGIALIDLELTDGLDMVFATMHLTSGQGPGGASAEKLTVGAY